MKNEFEKLVDHELSGLQWDEGMQHSVLCAVRKEEKPVRRKMKAGMVFALVLVLAGSIALAAGLRFSLRYDVVRLADQALMETYGVSDELLTLFSKRVVIEGEQTTVVYAGLEDFSGMLGEYRVTVKNSRASAAWSFDNLPDVGWNAAKLRDVLEQCKQEGGYGKAVSEARYAAEAAGVEVHKKPFLPSEEESRAVEEGQSLSESEVQSMALLTVEEMDSLARAAIQKRFGLKKEQLDKLELVEESSVWMMQNGRPIYPAYYWLSQSDEGWSKGDGIYIVDVDVRTGEVDQIAYDVGLFGNG